MKKMRRATRREEKVKPKGGTRSQKSHVPKIKIEFATYYQGIGSAYIGLTASPKEFDTDRPIVVYEL